MRGTKIGKNVSMDIRFKVYEYIKARKDELERSGKTYAELAKELGEVYSEETGKPVTISSNQIEKIARSAGVTWKGGCIGRHSQDAKRLAYANAHEIKELANGVARMERVLRRLCSELNVNYDEEAGGAEPAGQVLDKLRQQELFAAKKP